MYAAEALEAMNRGCLELSVGLGKRSGIQSVLLVGKFWSGPAGDPGRKLLAFQELNLTKERYDNLTNAAFRMVYTLDGMLADLESTKNDTA
jgi:hypothetical protein